MRWRRNIFISVVSCCQLFLFAILIYLIRFCGKNSNSATEAVVTEADQRDTDRISYLSKMAGTAYNKMSSLVYLPKRPTVFLSSGVVDKNESDKLFARAKEDNSFERGNQSYLMDRKHNKKRLKLIVAILSAPIRFDRREGIRRTWMNQCTSEEVVCRFFTDSLSDMEPNVRSVLANESAKYGDLEFMPIPKGYNFGLRLLWLMEWSVKRYHFDFFLRMDDDYFVCLKRLLFEIPFRPQKR